MHEICICCAQADEPLARRMATYLEAQIESKVDIIRITPWCDLLESVEAGLDCESVFGVLSPSSLAGRFERERWDAFLQPHVAWLLAQDCQFPGILKRQAFFDVRSGYVDRFRVLRPWILSGEIRSGGELQDFVDVPGFFSSASTKNERAYFDSAIDIDTAGRSVTSLAVELAMEMGVYRGGGRETLIEDVRRALCLSRHLITVHGERPPFLDNPGRATIVSVDGAAPAVTAPERMLVTLLACSKGRAEEPAIGDLDRALAHAFATAEWPLTRELAAAAYAFLKDRYRLAEAYDLMQSVRSAAQFYGDLDTMNQAIGEQSWIGEQWSMQAAAEDERETPQLTFGW